MPPDALYILMLALAALLPPAGATPDRGSMVVGGAGRVAVCYRCSSPAEPYCADAVSVAVNQSNVVSCANGFCSKVVQRWINPDTGLTSETTYTRGCASAGDAVASGCSSGYDEGGDRPVLTEICTCSANLCNGDGGLGSCGVLCAAAAVAVIATLRLIGSRSDQAAVRAALDS